MPGEKVAGGEDISTGWEVLSAESDAKWFALQSKEAEYDFSKRIDSLNNAHESMGINEFERWEDDFADNYKAAENKAYEITDNFADFCDVMVNSVAYPGGGREKDLAKTIEAQAGNYFPKRKRDLETAISASSKTPEEKEKDRGAISAFAEAVYRHMDFKNKSREDVAKIGFDTYESSRTKVHNDTMKTLNNLNDLARAYGVRPFTVRNFCPSDTVLRQNQTLPESTIMRYDRDIVEEYYAIAFPREAEKAEAEWKKYQKYGVLE